MASKKAPPTRALQNARKKIKISGKKIAQTSKALKKPIRKPPSRSAKRALDALARILKGVPQKRKRYKKVKLGGKRAKPAYKYVEKKKPVPKKRKPISKGNHIPEVTPQVVTEQLPSGTIKRIIFPVPYKNLSQWLEACAAQYEKDPTLGGQIPPGAVLGFRFFGNNSLRTYASFKDALLRLSAYESTIDAIEDHPEKQGEIYKAIEFVAIDSNATWTTDTEFFSHEYRAIKRRRRKKAMGLASGKWERLKQRNPLGYRQQLLAKRARARARYLSKKNDPTYKEAQRVAARNYRARLRRHVRK